MLFGGWRCLSLGKAWFIPTPHTTSCISHPVFVILRILLRIHVKAIHVELVEELKPYHLFLMQISCCRDLYGHGWLFKLLVYHRCHHHHAKKQKNLTDSPSIEDDECEHYLISDGFCTIRVVLLVVVVVAVDSSLEGIWNLGHASNFQYVFILLLKPDLNVGKVWVEELLPEIRCKIKACICGVNQQHLQ